MVSPELSLLQQGESSHYVKEQMGHASIQTTVDIYGHLVPCSNRNAVNKLDDDASQNLKIVPAAGWTKRLSLSFSQVDCFSLTGIRPLRATSWLGDGRMPPPPSRKNAC